MMTSLTQFTKALRESPAALVMKSVPAAGRTPLDLYRRLARNGVPSFLLESAEGGLELARYSFLGSSPARTLRGIAAGTEIRGVEGDFSFDPRNAIDLLRDHLKHCRVSDDAALPPFAGGGVGYLAYEAAAWFEPALAEVDAPENETLARFMLVDTLIAFDRKTSTINLLALSAPPDDEGLEAASRYTRACGRIDALLRRLESATPESAPAPSQSEGQSEYDLDPDDFEDAVRRIQGHITAGDCYQVVLSRKLSTTTAAKAIDIYQALREINPSPYLFLLDFGDEQLIGASPEMLVRCRNGSLEYRPIAGTCPRGGSPAEDDSLAQALLADEKERAEHVMLVDLGRNDLGRVAETGSVEVRRLMRIERYSHVQHIVTDLGARLRPGLDPFDALAACF
ncbi:MAG: chorismate-binding protein, partial [Terriglobales bacterium]